MSRNFGIPKKVESGPAVGGTNQPNRSHIAPYTTRRNPEPPAGLSAGPANSRPQQGESFIHEFEFGSYLLFGSVLAAPPLIVCAAVFFYALLIA